MLVLICFFLGGLMGAGVAAQHHELVVRASTPRVVTTCKIRGTFALTFDDGPYGYDPALAELLSKNKAKGTWFVNGNNWTPCIYDRAEELQRIYKAGHVIGSHTWSHPDIATLSPAKLESELTKVETALKKILGVKPALFRAPYGSITAANLQVLARRGYTAINWDFDSGDAVGVPTSESIKQIQARAKKFPQPGIGLAHSTKEATLKQIMPASIKALKAKGYKLVSVDECLSIKPYQKVYWTKLRQRDSTWKC